MFEAVDMRASGLLFWAQDSRASEKFYKKLGFEVIRSDDSHSVVKLGMFELTLVTMRDEDEFARDALANDKGRGVCLYIAVSDVDAAYSELIADGLKPATEPRDWEWGNREFIIKDPDGYKLCFSQKSKA